MKFQSVHFTVKLVRVPRARVGSRGCTHFCVSASLLHSGVFCAVGTGAREVLVELSLTLCLLSVLHLNEAHEYSNGSGS